MRCACSRCLLHNLFITAELLERGGVEHQMCGASTMGVGKLHLICFHLLKFTCSIDCTLSFCWKPSDTVTSIVDLWSTFSRSSSICRYIQSCLVGEIAHRRTQKNYNMAFIISRCNASGTVTPPMSNGRLAQFTHQSDVYTITSGVCAMTNFVCILYRSIFYRRIHFYHEWYEL